MTPDTIIVGCGAVAQRLYRKPLQQLEKRGILRVTGLVDPAVSHAEVLGRSFPRAARFTEIEAALAGAQPALTLVLSPANLHCDQTIQALLAGSHVLCEKPMASTTADCERMTAAAEKSQRILAIGMIRRFFPAFAELRRLVVDGRLGSLQSFEYREGHKFEWDVTTPAAFRPRALGGTGVLFDIGPHVIDHLAWTFGELRVVSYADDALGGIESNVSMRVESPSCPGAIHLSWDNPQANELRVFGSAGEAVLRINQFDQLAVSRDGLYQPQTIAVSFAGDAEAIMRVQVSPRSYTEAIYCELVQVVRAIRGLELPAADAASGRRCVAVLESALSLAQPLDMPWLDPSEQNAAISLHWTKRR